MIDYRLDGRNSISRCRETVSLAHPAQIKSISIKGKEREAQHSFLFNAEVNNPWSFPQLPYTVS
jgi:hypothetical protein